jgi:hypothetical protein
LVGACAVLNAVGMYAATWALRHLRGAGQTYLEVVGDRDAALRLLADVRASLFLHLVVSIVGLLGLAPLAVSVRRPHPAARVAAWIIGALVCAGLILVIAAGPDSLVSPVGGEPPAVRDALDDLLIGWYPGLTSILVTVELAATAVYSVLLFGIHASDFYYSRREGVGGLWTVLRR